MVIMNKQPMYDEAATEKEQIPNMKRQCLHCNFVSHENRKPIYGYVQVQQGIGIEIRTELGKCVSNHEINKANNECKIQIRNDKKIRGLFSDVEDVCNLMSTKLEKNH